MQGGRCVGGITAAHAQHTHRQNLGAVGHTNHTGIVIADGANDAGHMRAVPRRVFYIAQAGLGVPVAGVQRIGVAPISIVGRREIARAIRANEVIARHNVGYQVYMWPVASIQNRHRHARAADRHTAHVAAPGIGQVGPASYHIRRLQVALLGGVESVIG